MDRVLGDYRVEIFGNVFDIAHRVIAAALQAAAGNADNEAADALRGDRSAPAAPGRCRDGRFCAGPLFAAKMTAGFSYTGIMPEGVEGVAEAGFRSSASRLAISKSAKITASFPRVKIASACSRVNPARIDMSSVAVPIASMPNHRCSVHKLIHRFHLDQLQTAEVLPKFMEPQFIEPRR